MFFDVMYCCCVCSRCFVSQGGEWMFIDQEVKECKAGKRRRGFVGIRRLEDVFRHHKAVQGIREEIKKQTYLSLSPTFPLPCYFLSLFVSPWRGVSLNLTS